MRSEKEIRNKLNTVISTKVDFGRGFKDVLEWVLEDDGWHDAREELPPRNADYKMILAYLLAEEGNF